MGASARPRPAGGSGAPLSRAIAPAGSAWPGQRHELLLSALEVEPRGLSELEDLGLSVQHPAGVPLPGMVAAAWFLPPRGSRHPESRCEALNLGIAACFQQSSVVRDKKPRLGVKQSPELMDQHLQPSPASLCCGCRHTKAAPLPPPRVRTQLPGHKRGRGEPGACSTHGQEELAGLALPWGARTQLHVPGLEGLARPKIGEGVCWCPFFSRSSARVLAMARETAPREANFGEVSIRNNPEAWSGHRSTALLCAAPKPALLPQNVSNSLLDGDISLHHFSYRLLLPPPCAPLCVFCSSPSSGWIRRDGLGQDEGIGVPGVSAGAVGTFTAADRGLRGGHTSHTPLSAAGSPNHHPKTSQPPPGLPGPAPTRRKPSPKNQTRARRGARGQPGLGGGRAEECPRRRAPGAKQLESRSLMK